MRLTRGFLTMLGVAVAAIVVMAIIDLLRPVPPQERMQALRQQLTELRAASDSCRGALAREEARLRYSDERFEYLRSRIEHYESLDPRGVPADSYDIYMRYFNDYNEGIPARELAGDTLRAHEEACRALIVEHNLIADSALALAEELGLIRDSLIRQPIMADTAEAADSSAAPKSDAP